MPRPDVFDSLARMSGPEGDDARQSIEEAPRAYETPADTTQRVATQSRQRAFYGRVKAEDLSQRGIAHYTTPRGETREVTDASGTPLTNADKANKVAYDSTGRPVDYSTSGASGEPVLKDPYESAPTVTDKSGGIYKAPKNLPWQQVGTDQHVADAVQKKQTRQLNSKAYTALGGEETDLHSQARADAKAVKESAKNTTGALMGAMPDEQFDLNADPATLRSQVETAFNREYGSRKANEKPWFGGGKLSPQAEAYRRDIDARKAQAIGLLGQHSDLLSRAQQSQANLQTVQQQRQGLRGDRLADVNEERVAAGLQPVGLPAEESAHIESAVAQETGAPAIPTEESQQAFQPQALPEESGTSQQPDELSSPEGEQPEQQGQAEPSLYDHASSLVKGALHGLASANTAATGIPEHAVREGIGATVSAFGEMLKSPLGKAASAEASLGTQPLIEFLSGQKQGSTAQAQGEELQKIPGVITDPAFHDTGAAKAGRFVGGTLPYLAAGAVAPEAMIPLLFSTGYQGQVDAAKEHGADDETAMKAGLLGGAINSVLGIPFGGAGKVISSMFGKAELPVVEAAFRNAYGEGGATGVANLLNRWKDEIVRSGVIPAGMQEGFANGFNNFVQQINRSTLQRVGSAAATAARDSALFAGAQAGQNVVAQTYDPNQSLTEGVGESALGGLALGGLFGGLRETSRAKTDRLAREAMKPGQPPEPTPKGAAPAPPQPSAPSQLAPTEAQPPAPPSPEAGEPPVVSPEGQPPVEAPPSSPTTVAEGIQPRPSPAPSEPPPVPAATSSNEGEGQQPTTAQGEQPPEGTSPTGKGAEEGQQSAQVSSPETPESAPSGQRSIIGPALADAEGNILISGQIGQTHAQLKLAAAKQGIDATEAEHVFLDNEGHKLDRTEAAKVAEEAGQRLAGTKGPLHSEHLTSPKVSLQSESPSSATPPAQVESQKAPKPVAEKAKAPAVEAPVAESATGGEKPSSLLRAAKAHEVLNDAAKVKLTVPKGARFIRVTDQKGRQIVEPLENVTKGANVFHQAGPFKKVEAGILNKAKQFVGIKGDVIATDASKPSEPASVPEKASAEPATPDSESVQPAKPPTEGKEVAQENPPVESSSEQPATTEKASPDVENVTKLAKAALKLHHPELDALGHPHEFTEGDTFSNTGIEANSDTGKIMVDYEKLARSAETAAKKAIKLDPNRKLGQAKLEFIKKVVEEEVDHLKTIAFERSAPENRARIEALNENEPDIAKGLEKSYNGWEKLDRRQKGHEIFRTILQARNDPNGPRPTTESTYKLIEDFIKWLKKHVANLKGEAAKLVKELEDMLARLRAEKESEPTKEQAPPEPEKPISFSYYDKEGRDQSLEASPKDAKEALESIQKSGGEVHAVDGRIVGKKTAEELVVEKSEPTSAAEPLAAADPREEGVEPFYSQLTRTVESMPQATMTVAQARAAISKGAKPDEIKMSGILTDPLSPLVGKSDTDKVTRYELADYATERQTKVQDVVLGGDEAEAAAKAKEDALRTWRREQVFANELSGRVTNRAIYHGYTQLEAANLTAKLDDGRVSVDELPKELREDANAYLAQLEKFLQSKFNLENVKDAPGNPTHFSQYQLPGAEPGSYREMFVTWPELPAKDNPYSVGLDPHPESAPRSGNYVIFKDGEVQSRGFTTVSAAQKESERLGHKIAGWGDGHPAYQDIRNPVVRIRRNIRTDANGKRTYFIEEMQGPTKDEQPKMPPEVRKRIYEIGMKRAIRDAVDSGADAIGWTRGDQQAERYSLEKQLSKVRAIRSNIEGEAKHTVALNAYDLEGNHVLSKRVDESELEATIGKELASKIMEQPRGADRSYTGLDLKVGGAGLRNLYDKTLPAIANKLAEKVGGKVGESEIETNREIPTREGFVEWYQSNFPDTGATTEELRKTWDDPNSPHVAEYKSGEPTDIEQSTIHSMDLPASWKQTPPSFALYAANPATPAGKIDGVLNRVLKAGRFFWEGAADTLERAGYHDLAKAARQQFETEHREFGKAWKPLREALDIPGPKQKVAKDEFESYYKDRENGRAAKADGDLKKFSPEGQQLIQAWKDVAVDTGKMLTKLGVEVKDGEKYRPIGNLGEKFFPRKLNQDTYRVLSEPEKYPKEWSKLVQDLVDNGNIKDPSEADKFLKETLWKEDTKNDYYANIEQARKAKLPESWLDYKFDEIAPWYVSHYARRVGQIEAYGQEHKEGGDLFDKALADVPKRKDYQFTQEYLKGVKDAAYYRNDNTSLASALRNLQMFATGSFLSNPMSAIRNVVSGVAQTGVQFGPTAMLKASFKTMMDLRNQINSAKDLGILRDNITEMMMDSRDIQENRIQRGVRKVVNAGLTATGFNLAENFARATSMAAAKTFAQQAAADIKANPDSAKSKQAKAFFTRHHIDPQKIVDENGTGPTTDKFTRASVREGQFGYNFDQTPLYQSNPIMKFLLQFQKWGTQMARFWAKHVINPAIHGTDIGGGEKVRTLKPLLLAAAAAIGGGELLYLIKELLTGRESPDATAEEIKNALDQNTKEGISQLTSRLFGDIINGGQLGIFGDYAGNLREFATRGRAKSPFSPPGVEAFKNIFNAIATLKQQGKITPGDVWDIVRNQFPGAKFTEDMARHVAGDQLQKAIITQTDARRAGMRMAKELDLPVQAPFSAAMPVKTEKTPLYSDVGDALLTGDAATARKTFGDYQKTLKTQADRDKAMTALRASITQHQPIKVGGIASAQNAQKFTQWARKRLPEDQYRNIVALQSRYWTTAARAGFVQAPPVAKAAAPVKVANPRIFQFR